MENKLKKPSKFYMVNMEQMLHDLLVDIMERYDYDLEQAQELINTVVKAQAEEIEEELDELLKSCRRLFKFAKDKEAGDNERN